MSSAGKLELRAIEFASDGLRDSLTGALAPARFNEILQSELAMARREQRSITVISLRLGRHASNLDLQPDLQFIHLSLKAMAAYISPLLRSGDQLGRISEDGFWILIRADLAASVTASERLFPRGAVTNSDPSMKSGSVANEEADWRIQFCESEPGESLKSWMRRIDSLHFSG